MIALGSGRGHAVPMCPSWVSTARLSQDVHVSATFADEHLDLFAKVREGNEVRFEPPVHHLAPENLLELWRHA
jgi:hypothetical protein